jgi:ribose transport system substrate-binding protein
MRKSLALILVPFVVTLTACGSSSSSDSSSTSSQSAPASASTGSAGLPAGTIGVLQIQGAAEAVARVSADIKKANSAVGWKTLITDGKGNPAAMGQAMTDFIARKVDAIITVAVDSPAIAPQIEQAKAAGIPVLSAPFTVTDPNHLYTANLGPSTAGYVDSMASYLKSKFPSGAKFVSVDVPAVGSAHEFTVGVTKELRAAGFDDQGVADADPADIVNSFTAATSNILQAHPDTQVLVSCCDFSPPIQLPILKSMGRTKVLLTGRFDNLSSLALFAQNDNLVLGAANMDTGVLLALDAIYAFKANHTAIPSDDQAQYDFSIVDKSNVPTSGKFFFTPDEQINKFVSKWKAEYAG